jgi:signal-transduction protein with cAMP-binding, CBS, and nucleotidyltransferase domain
MRGLRFPSVVSDVMKNIISIEGSCFISEAAKKMIENKIGSIIITEDGMPSGIVTRSDMISKVIVAHLEPGTNKINTIKSSPLISIEHDTPILEAMRFLRDQDINQVLIREGDKISGIVSEGDLIRAVTLCSLAQFSTLLHKK